jgi:HAMP domain-containing protein
LEKKAKKKKLRYPTKTTLNLVIREDSINRPAYAFPIFILIVIAVLAFAKFAVIDRLAELSAARTNLASQQAELKTKTGANADFNKVTNEYNRYFFSGYSEAENSQTDRTAIINLLEQKLIYSAKVSSIAVMGNKATVVLSGVTLEELSAIMRNIKDDKNVSEVAVSSAGTQSKTEGGKLAAVTLTITFKKPEKEGSAK